MSGVPWHVETIRKEEGDDRRHRSRCAYYNKETHQCSKLFGMQCVGSAHCDIYKESSKNPDKHVQRKNTKNDHGNAHRNKLERKDLQMDFNGDPNNRKNEKKINPSAIFYEGCIITHKKYGIGKVKEIKGDHVLVGFDDGESHILNVKTCIDNNLIACNDVRVVQAMNKATSISENRNQETQKSAINNSITLNKDTVTASKSDKDIDPIFAVHTIGDPKIKKHEKKTKKSNQSGYVQLSSLYDEDYFKDKNINQKRDNTPVKETRKTVAKKQDITGVVEDSDYKTIDLNSVVYYSKTDSEIKHKHKIERIDAVVSIRQRQGGQVKKYRITARYCNTCNAFFIKKEIYDKIVRAGIPICRMIDQESDLSHYSGSKFDKYEAQSLLKEYGYNVEAKNNLSPVIRRDILKSLIEEGICDKHFIISHLEVFIYDHKNVEKYQYAVQKWEDDLDYIRDYKPIHNNKDNINQSKLRQNNNSTNNNPGNKRSSDIIIKPGNSKNQLYQAYVVQNFNGVPYNVILGHSYHSIEEACDAIKTYESAMGKAIKEVVEPNGNIIPTRDQKSFWKDLKDTFLKFFK